jgi:WD40 repeat protein
MRFTPDGTGLFVADERGEVVLWDTTTGNVKLRWKAHGDGVWFLAVSADGKVLLTKGVTTTLVWDVNRLQELAAAGKGR